MPDSLQKRSSRPVGRVKRRDQIIGDDASRPDKPRAAAIDRRPHRHRRNVLIHQDPREAARLDRRGDLVDVRLVKQADDKPHSRSSSASECSTSATRIFDTFPSASLPMNRTSSTRTMPRSTRSISSRNPSPVTCLSGHSRPGSRSVQEPCLPSTRTPSHVEIRASSWPSNSTAARVAISCYPSRPTTGQGAPPTAASNNSPGAGCKREIHADPWLGARQRVFAVRDRDPLCPSYRFINAVDGFAAHARQAGSATRSAEPRQRSMTRTVPRALAIP